MKTYLGLDAPLPDNSVRPHPIDICIHLGREKRFGGWGRVPEWSVLHHSMMVAMLYLAEYGSDGLKGALLHDAHEYITGDIPSPVKRFLGKDVKELEEFLDGRILSMMKVGRDPDYIHHRVKLCDAAALIIEAYWCGTPGTFEHIAEVDWGINFGKTEEDRESIRRIILNLCPEVVQFMGTTMVLSNPEPGEPAAVRLYR